MIVGYTACACTFPQSATECKYNMFVLVKLLFHFSDGKYLLGHTDVLIHCWHDTPVCHAMSRITNLQDAFSLFMLSVKAKEPGCLNQIQPHRTPLYKHSSHLSPSILFILLSRRNGEVEHNVEKSRPFWAFLAWGAKCCSWLLLCYDGRTTRVVTTDVAASGVRQRFTYYTSNLDVF